MSGLSGNSGPPKPFQYSSFQNIWTPKSEQLYNEYLLSPNYGVSSDDSAPPRRRTKKRTKNSKKHSKSSKRRREHQLQGYILQIIGLLCFILAAVKSFEPLTGVGFTLVLIGYNRNAKKQSSVDLSSEGKREKRKRETCKQNERHVLVRYHMDNPVKSGEETI